MRLWLVLVLVATSLWTPASAADPNDVVPESLRKYWSTLSDIVNAAGNNKVDRALEHAAIDLNPAFRTADERGKFRESFQKLMAQIGKFHSKFESFDIVAVAPISSQAFTVYSIANGDRGPMHTDFDVYFYKGRWHIQGLHFNAGWKRDREIAPRTVYFDKPVVFRLDQAEVASK